MDPARTCPDCDAPLPVDSPAGHCPRCLFQIGLETNSETPDAAAFGSFPRPFGHYELLAEIGRGGMGVVYRARQLGPNRVVALKVILAGPLASPSFVRRFQMEAEAAAQLDHPNIVPLYEVGEAEGQHYFTMKLIEGGSLAERIFNNEFLTTNDTVRVGMSSVIAKVARAVHYAHQHGILHRDLKPSNILIDATDEPHLTDFGLAKMLASDRELTLTREVLGSPNYMAPEQAAGRSGPVTTTSDVYSLGAILYKLLTARAPFLAETPVETLYQVLHTDPTLPSAFNPAVPRDLETICLKCLEKEPARRYQSALALAEDLERFARDEPIAACPVGPVEKSWRWCRRNPRLAVLGLTVIVLLAAIAIGSPVAVWRIASARDREQRERQRAEAALTRMEIHQTEELFKTDNAAAALAYIGRVLRREPTNRFAAERMLASLMQRNFPLPLENDRSQGPGRAFDVTAMVTRSARAAMLASSPDGNVGAVVSNHTLRIVDIRTGQPLTASLEHGNQINSVQFSANGERIATASDDFTARVWNARTGQLIAGPLQHKDFIYLACFSPDGSRLVTASKDRSARVWDAVTGQAITEPLRHEDKVTVAAFSPDGLRVATGSRDSTARVWDARTGLPWSEPMRHLAEVLSLQFSVDGQELFTRSADNSSHLWDIHPGAAACIVLPHRNPVLCAQFSPDGSRVATGCNDGLARLWDVRTGRPLSHGLSHQGGAISSVQFSPDGRRLATASYEHTARIWDAFAGQPLLTPLLHDAPVVWVAFNPDGSCLATACRDHTARLWNATNGQAMTPPLRHEDKVYKVEFSSDGYRLLTASYDNTARLWDTRSGAIIGEPLRHNARVTSARFSSDGEQVVTGSFDGTARVWDARTGRALTGPMRHRSEIHSACFSPNGWQVLTASSDMTAQIWDARAGQPLAEPMKHQDYVFDAQFSPDGLRVVTASWDQTARIWDSATGRPLGDPIRHPNGLRAASFSPDGRWVVTACDDGTARIWELPRAKMPIARWLPELAEAVGGQRFNAQGLLESVPATELFRLRQELLLDTAVDDCTLWAKWFFADRTMRKISPSSAVTAP